MGAWVNMGSGDTGRESVLFLSISQYYRRAGALFQYRESGLSVLMSSPSWSRNY